MLSKSIAIVDTLRASLDRSTGGELGQRGWRTSRSYGDAPAAGGQFDLTAIEEVMGLAGN